LHAGQAQRVLEEQLVRRIRQWQPDVVIAPGGSGREGRAEDELLRRATLAAIEAAASTSAYPEQIAAAKLQAWQVKKVFTMAAEGEADDVTVTGARLALRSGRSLGDVAARWQGLLSTEFAMRPATIGFRLATHDVAAEVARRDFFSGLLLNPGGEARRRLSDPPAASADFVRDQAQRQRHAERLLAATSAGIGSDAAWLAQIEQLTGSLERGGAARAVYQLAERYQQSGRVALAEETLEMLSERYHDTPESEAALRQLFFNYTSAEQAWRQKSHEASAVQPATAIGAIDDDQEVDTIATKQRDATGDVVVAGGVSSAEKLAIERCGRAMAMYKVVERQRPSLAMEPSWQLALAAAQRTAGETRGAEAIYRRLAAGDQQYAWVGCARAELWLAQQRGTCPKPLVRLRRDAERPFLDGRLDDAVWQTAQPLTLTSRYGDDRAWPAVAMLACDGEYFYFAATCRNAPAGDSLPIAGENLMARDRVQICIDVNRDWHSHFRFVVDPQGATAESCVGDASWNPKWHAAQNADQQTWTVEAAVPLAMLGVEIAKHDAWAVGVQRIAPGAGVQSWAQPGGVQAQPGGMGLVLFE
jgi:hypothetical protein